MQKTKTVRGHPNWCKGECECIQPLTAGIVRMNKYKQKRKKRIKKEKKKKIPLFFDLFFFFFFPFPSEVGASPPMVWNLLETAPPLVSSWAPAIMFDNIMTNFKKDKD
eukprot:Lithocolla_globosa_v1_NODE_295_length_4617_cov_21.598203.p3 type:complete len:108 gc:universal NODE_295_length_4617_cov_21.598203:959-636(-)